MNYNNTKIKYLLLTLAISLSGILRAQVTIGMAEEPVAGALLELKSNADGSSNKGLALPRIALTDPYNLYPMFEPDGTNYKIGKVKYLKDNEDRTHTGLTVYNINTANSECTGLSKGLYVWSGEQWIQLSGSKIAEEDVIKGNYASDVAALKELYNSNPSNTLGWNLDTDPIFFTGVTWETICGEQRVVKLQVNRKGLTASTGIDKLYMLTELSCNSNKLTNLDVSNITNLTSLNCNTNQLPDLDISKNIKLEKLDCYFNRLTNLDVSNNINLTTLTAQINLLTDLDIANNVNLTTLNINSNQLTNLDVSKNVNLEKLSCSSNKLKDLDVLVNIKLKNLDCSSNELTDLDLSNNLALSLLHCYTNQLTSLDLSNNINLTLLHCHTNKLTNLSVSNIIGLTDLYCYTNQLTSLDVSTNINLKALSCHTNKLTQLELDKLKNNPNFCGASFNKADVVPQRFPGTNTTDKSVVIPTCP